MPISATGMLTAGISVARQSRRKAKITAITIRTARPRVIRTSWIAPSMKTASSAVTKIDTSSGRIVSISATASRTRSEMSRVFEPAWRMMPIPRPVWPLVRSTLSLRSGPMVTRATSPSRVSGVTLSASNAASVATAAVVRTTRLWLALDIVPAGASKSALSSTSRTCARVRPRLASATGSMSTRKISERSP